MALHCMFFSYSGATWQGLVAKPEDRTAAVSAAMESLGGRLVSMHYMLGPHDGLVIAELPDTVGIAAVSALASYRPALPPDATIHDREDRS